MSPHPTPDEMPDACTCAALRQAARSVSRLYDEALAPVGLSLNQYSMLSKLDRFGPLSLQQLAGHLVTDRSTLGHLLRPLETRSLVTIAVSGSDRRQRRITLTPDGVALLNQARPLWAQVERRFAAAFGKDASQALRSALNQAAKIVLDAAPPQ